VETSRLGDISIVVTSPKGDISNVAAWGHYQSRATPESSAGMQKTLPFLKKVGHRQLDPCFSPWERQLPQPGFYTQYKKAPTFAVG
jgi:hypothetical protein